MNGNQKIKSYSYRFVQKINPTPDDCFLHKLLYTFKSPKSNYWYWIVLELYKHNIYAVKFHLKADRDNPNKYHKLTDLKEFRPIINTCIKVVLDVFKKDSCASFGFIGSNTITKDYVEPKENTKRYRVYKRLVLTYFSDEYFKHIVDTQHSSYMLLKRTELKKNPNLEKDIVKLFASLYNELT